MLDKDHQSRIDLDGIVEDDWVTHEGSDPFFFDGAQRCIALPRAFLPLRHRPSDISSADFAMLFSLPPHTLYLPPIITSHLIPSHYTTGGPGTPPVLIDSDQDLEVAPPPLSLPHPASVGSLCGLLIDVPPEVLPPAISPKGGISPTFCKVPSAIITVRAVVTVFASPFFAFIYIYISAECEFICSLISLNLPLNSGLPCDAEGRGVCARHR
jgi:hypothetical protein